jgi:hypothetical protein
VAEPSGGLNCTCPSARCEEGATLLGVVGPTGVGYVTPRFLIDAEFVRTARREPSPERVFRFAGQCVEGDCAQWTGSRCGIIDMAIRTQRSGIVPAAARPLPRCSIRPTCRWYFQAGPEACAVCPLVVTDGTTDERAMDRSAVPEGQG